MKKRLTQTEEFEIMKLVLDKFLWLGFIIMGYGMYVMVAQPGSTIMKGLSIMIAGAIVLLLFMILIVKEYEVIK
ncbi:hypothetical protein HQ529_06580 [Candidatus Woesearchaeota archaeon]|nr:hypothetical protein [Candidatus Woesearchaeota archaeon]